MLRTSRVIVVVPCLNEAPRISNVVATIPGWVDHIVVVDDASTDGTAEVAAQAGDERVVVLRHAENRGVGAAIVSGYGRAIELTSDPRDAICVMAGDGQMDPDDLARVVDPVVDGHAGYVKGNRFLHPELMRRMPTVRRLGGRFLSWATSIAIGRRVEDTQCGYTAISRAALVRIDVGRLFPRFGYPNDLLSLVALSGESIAEVVVAPVYGDEESKLRPRHVFGIAYVVGRAGVRRAMRRGGGAIARRRAPGATA